MASFSLTEKIAVTGAFLALVAMAVGTEDDPGPVIAGQEAVADLRLAPSVKASASPSGPEVARSKQVLAPPPLAAQPTTLPTPAVAATASAAQSEDEDDEDAAFSPELGRVPRDFSKGPPPG